MFKTLLKNKRYEKENKIGLEDKIALYLDMDKNSFKKSKIENCYVNPWLDISNKIENASEKKITIYNMGIPKEKEGFFAKKYNDKNLKFVVIPEKYLIGVNYANNEEGKYDANLKNMKKMTLSNIKTERFNNLIEKINIKDNVLDKYKFGKEKKKFLIAKTKNGSYFISKEDIIQYQKNPVNFLVSISRKNNSAKENDIFTNKIEYGIIQPGERSTKYAIV